MTDDLTPEEIAAIVEQIAKDQDPYQLPASLVNDSEEPKGRPASSPDPSINKSLYNQIRAMSVGERLKLALKGNRDARAILIHDSNHLIPRFVLQNPRITEDEVVALARNRNTDTELLRLIGEQREWSRNHQVKSALATNPKTPVAIALRFVGSLTERELRMIAKSKNVTSAVATSAKRILFQRTSTR
jgi:hypothetical protein